MPAYWIRSSRRFANRQKTNLKFPFFWFWIVELRTLTGIPDLTGRPTRNGRRMAKMFTNVVQVISKGGNYIESNPCAGLRVARCVGNSDSCAPLRGGTHRDRRINNRQV